MKGKGVVHRGKYQRLTGKELDRMIDFYDTEDPRYGLIGDCEEKGHRHYLDFLFGSWFSFPRKGAGGRAPRRDPAARYLERAGFL